MEESPAGASGGGSGAARKIIHIDMDAFFASIEQRDRPELRGRPVIVGGLPEHRGVVSTCSYEARAFGVHSAMPTRTAFRLCPEAVLLHPDIKKYKRISAVIRGIFHDFTDLVEPVSIDEAYLDVTVNKRGERSASRIAREIQREIFQKTRLTASAGVSCNKFLAKVASDLHKPAGLTVIRPEEAESFLDAMPVEKFHGIGRATAARLLAMNVRTGHDLRQLDRSTLAAHFGKVGEFYYRIVRGIDDRPVETGDEPKSVGKEITLSEDSTDRRQLRIMVRTLSYKVARLLLGRGLLGRTVTVKLRFGDFHTVTRSQSFPEPVPDGGRLGEIALELAEKGGMYRHPIRLVGVTVSNFLTPEELNRPVQLEFDF